MRTEASLGSSEERFHVSTMEYDMGWPDVNLDSYPAALARDLNGVNGMSCDRRGVSGTERYQSHRSCDHARSKVEPSRSIGKQAAIGRLSCLFHYPCCHLTWDPRPLYQHGFHPLNFIFR